MIIVARLVYTLVMRVFATTAAATVFCRIVKTTRLASTAVASTTTTTADASFRRPPIFVLLGRLAAAVSRCSARGPLIT